MGVDTIAGPTGTIRATGEITAGYSDIRLKDNILTIPKASSKLYSLDGVVYRPNKLAESFGYTDIDKKIGVIAQQVKKILPEIVQPAPFDVIGKDGSKSGENYLTVQYEYLVPLIIETIKDQQKELDEIGKVLSDE